MTVVLRTDHHTIKRGFFGWYHVYDAHGLYAKFRLESSAFNYVRTKEWKERTKAAHD